jgi:hypothetical protein
MALWLLTLSLFSTPALAAPSAASFLEEWLNQHGRPSLPLSYALPESNDQAAALVDELRYTNLRAMEEAKLERGSVQLAPWSGYYWPAFFGGLAYRYNDPAFPAWRTSWETNEAYLQAQLGQGPSELLSPAEKYDLLVGDESFTLTKNMLASSRRAWGEDKYIEPWIGHCHGWSPASFMVDRPEKPVTVPSFDGKRQLTFYPDDIRALAVLWWAKGEHRVRFVGSRCEEDSPWTGPRGREVRTPCRDTNPATFHLALVNQIGHSRRPFIMDTAKNSEVWNQPIQSYTYSLSNPVTRLTGDAVTAVAPFPEDDSGKDFRAPTAVAFTKVTAFVTHTAEKDPKAVRNEGELSDATVQLRYEYELELDRDGNIVGGEWMMGSHPDFLWVPPRGAEPRTAGDAAIDKLKVQYRWVAGKRIPNNWHEKAGLSSIKSQPLGRIVKQLVRWSAKAEGATASGAVAPALTRR